VSQAEIALQTLLLGSKVALWSDVGHLIDLVLLIVDILFTHRDDSGCVKRKGRVVGLRRGVWQEEREEGEKGRGEGGGGEGKGGSGTGGGG